MDKNMKKETTIAGKKLEDAKSSSWLFVIFGIIGLLFIGAVWLGIIPIRLAMYMKIMYTIILGALFILFIIVGIYYVKKSKVLAEESSSEEKLTEEILNRFSTECMSALQSFTLNEEDATEEQLCFERYEIITEWLVKEYDLKEGEYLDYMIEKIYQMSFPE